MDKTKIITVKSTNGEDVDINPIHVSHVVHMEKDACYIYIAGETYISVDKSEARKFSDRWKEMMPR